MAARRGSVIPLVIAGLLGLVLVLAVRQWVSGGDGAEEARADASGSTTNPRLRAEGCTTVSVVASSEKAALLGRLAEQYNGSGPQVGGACVWMAVSTKASGAATTALARGWDEEVDGPRPDVWSPASSSWAGLVDQGATDLDRPSPMPEERPSLVQTPLVIAMPLPMAQALGWPDAQIGWKDLAAIVEAPKGWDSKGHPEWGRFKLGKTNPYFSTSGLNATIAAVLRRHRTVQRPHVQAGRRPRDPGVRGEAGVLGRPLRGHDADLPGEHEPGGRCGPGADLRLGGHGRGEVGAGLQPRQSHRGPGDPGPAAAADRPPGRGVPLRRDPAVGQPVDHAGRRVGGRHQAPGRRRLPRLAARAAAAEGVHRRRLPDVRGRAGPGHLHRRTACCRPGRRTSSRRPRPPCSPTCRSPGTTCASARTCCS